MTYGCECVSVALDAQIYDFSFCQTSSSRCHHILAACPGILPYGYLVSPVTAAVPPFPPALRLGAMVHSEMDLETQRYSPSALQSQTHDRGANSNAADGKCANSNHDNQVWMMVYIACEQLRST